jgi:hypothetical protein
MKLLIGILIAVAAFGQSGSPVNQVADPPATAVVKQLFYDGSNNLQYVCWARQFQPSPTYQRRSDSTLTSIVVLTNVGTVTTASAHGLYVGARVTFSGATVDTDLNGTYTIATVPSSTTYTVATSAVANATYTESTLVVSTSQPLLTSTVWGIEVLIYNGSNYLTGAYWANASTSYVLACTSRTSY